MPIPKHTRSTLSSLPSVFCPLSSALCPQSPVWNRPPTLIFICLQTGVAPGFYEAGAGSGRKTEVRAGTGGPGICKSQGLPKPELSRNLCSRSRRGRFCATHGPRSSHRLSLNGGLIHIPRLSSLRLSRSGRVGEWGNCELGCGGEGCAGMVAGWKHCPTCWPKHTRSTLSSLSSALGPLSSALGHRTSDIG